MKKIIFALLLFGSLSFSGISQFKFGIEGGLNVTNYSQNNTDIIASTLEAGWLGGIKGRYSKEKWYGQIEVYYQQWSSLITSQTLAMPSNGIVIGYFTWENFQIPLTFGVFVYDGEDSKLRLFGGFDVALKTTVYDNAFNITSADLKSGNWGARVGIGVDFWERLAFDILYNIGFDSIFKNSAGAFRNLAFIFGININ